MAPRTPEVHTTVEDPTVPLVRGIVGMVVGFAVGLAVVAVVLIALVVEMFALGLQSEADASVLGLVPIETGPDGTALTIHPAVAALPVGGGILGAAAGAVIAYRRPRRSARASGSRSTRGTATT